MWWLLASIAVYFLLICYDFANLHGKKWISYSLAVAGIAMLIISSGYGIYSVFSIDIIRNHMLLKSVEMLGALGSLGLLVHCLFFALPARDTYINPQRIKLVNTGFYALCRHPGLWWLSLLYLFLWMLLEHKAMLYLWVINTFGDIVYVVIQDIFIFPKTIDGYHMYKLETPFLIPTRKSILRMFSNSE